MTRCDFGSLVASNSERLVSIPVNGVERDGILRSQTDAFGIVFAHGSDSSAKSPHNNIVAETFGIGGSARYFSIYSRKTKTGSGRIASTCRC